VLIDGRSVPHGARLLADICIVGCGPAGLTVAEELRSEGLEILIIESGDADATADQPDHRMEFRSPHFSSPEGSRRSGLGGMVGVWNTDPLGMPVGARYLPLDPIDFEHRSWVPNSGWPFGFDALRPFYERAQVRCGLGPFDYSATCWEQEGSRALVTDAGTLAAGIDQLGPASVFAVDAVQAMAAAPDVRVITSASAVEVTPASSGDELAEVRVRSTRDFTVAARSIVLAAGAIENARLLLASDESDARGLGNAHDNVGRYFMDHPRVHLGYGRLSSPAAFDTLSFYEHHVARGRVIVAKIKLSTAALRQHELLNGNAQILPDYRSVRAGAATQATKAVVHAVRSREQLRITPPLVRTIVVGSVGAASTRLRAGLRQRTRHPLLSPEPFRTGSHRFRSFTLRFQPEQAPDRDNRVRLGGGRDALGRRRAALEWRWSDLDLDSIRRTRQLFADELSAAGVGYLEPFTSQLPPGQYGQPQPKSAHHHLGTTRMHLSARHGVVDADCMVHGSPGLFVAGGSVFPTGGHANPTLTVVALSIRLADHLRRVLSHRPALDSGG
jgi:choline dehydrogenase-like flavoprotein